MKLSRLLFFILLASSTSLHAQIVGDLEDESKLYASSKQVNQFFRRFNGEEDEKGNRYYEGDKQYRNAKLRKKYLGILFDASNKGMTDAVKTEFAKNVLDKSLLLDFHGGKWFSEVHTTFTQNGKDQPITLFMALEKDHLGYKWVIQRAYAEMFAPYFARDTLKVGKFLHPLSHELDFMNLRKAFINSDSVSQFAAKSFKADHLTLFLYEIKKGTLKFKTVNEVKFHFFQIDGWYFELAQFNRPGYNTGWLISSLTRLNTVADGDALRKYLYYETK
jgi:hypothetical protein